MVQGCGSWAGIPYVCYSQLYLSCIFLPSLINVNELIRDTDSLASRGEIDSTDNLADDRVYIFHGTKDST